MDTMNVSTRRAPHSRVDVGIVSIVFVVFEQLIPPVISIQSVHRAAATD